MNIWGDTYATISLVKKYIKEFETIAGKKGYWVFRDSPGSLNFTYKIYRGEGNPPVLEIKRSEYPLPGTTSGGTWFINGKDIGGDNVTTVKRIIKELSFYER